MRLAILLACATSLFAQSATLTVDQGSASRNPTAGAVAHVWADPNTATQVFDGWTGDVQYLLDQAAWHTTLIMPTAAVNLRATYRTVPAWTARVGTFNGIGVTYTIPSDPIGLIFMFHGTGGTGALEFTSNQFLAFIREAVADGFAVAAFDSQDRTTKLLGTVATGIWNTTITGNGNPDIVRLNGIIQAMRSQGLISAQLPLFAFGQSNGGLFSHFSAPVMSWAAVAISCIPGSVNNGAPLYSGPVIWQLAANDDNLLVGAKGNADALANYESHADRRHPVRLIAWQPQPLYPARFARAGVVPPHYTGRLTGNLQCLPRQWMAGRKRHAPPESQGPQLESRSASSLFGRAGVDRGSARRNLYRARVFERIEPSDPRPLPARDRPPRPASARVRGQLSWA